MDEDVTGMTSGGAAAGEQTGSRQDPLAAGSRSAARRLLHPSPAWAEPAGTLGRSGGLEVRLAESAREVGRAQRLRFKVFFEDGPASPTTRARLSRRDIDPFDAVCDHLVVLDHDVPSRPFRSPKPRVVGTYRLLRREVAERRLGFYSAAEFDLAPLLARHPGTRFLELGRSCVARSYRSRQTASLLWQGIAAYVRHHGCEVMIGCASLDGTDARALRDPLGFLHHFAASPDAWRVRPHPERRVAMDGTPAEALDRREAFRGLPPLLKGYLRLGATVGDGAVADHVFGTTDVFVVLPLADIGARYLDHFGPPAANRVAA